MLGTRSHQPLRPHWCWVDCIAATSRAPMASGMGPPDHPRPPTTHSNDSRTPRNHQIMILCVYYKIPSLCTIILDDLGDAQNMQWFLYFWFSVMVTLRSRIVSFMYFGRIVKWIDIVLLYKWNVCMTEYIENICVGMGLYWYKVYRFELRFPLSGGWFSKVEIWHKYF